MVLAVPMWKNLINNGLTYRSNPRTTWIQEIANKFSYFFSILTLDSWIKTHSHSSFFPPFLFLFLTDIDECKTYPDKCHVNASCKNTNGSHVCTCKPGYTGDGRNCTGTVNNLGGLHIIFDCNDNFVFVVAVVFIVFYTVESQENVCNVGKGSYPQLVLGSEWER